MGEKSQEKFPKTRRPFSTRFPKLELNYSVSHCLGELGESMDTVVLAGIFAVNSVEPAFRLK